MSHPVTDYGILRKNAKSEGTHPGMIKADNFKTFVNQILISKLSLCLCLYSSIYLFFLIDVCFYFCFDINIKLNFNKNRV